MGRLIRLDWAIKKILRDKANFDILEGFLSELLRFEVRIVEILESEANQDHRRDKFNRVDLLVKNESDELVIIEIQNETELDYLQRLLYGACKAVVEHIDVGKPYSHVKKVFSVSIVYFDLGRGEDYIYHGTTSFRGLRKHDELDLTEEQQDAFQAETPAKLFPEYYLIKVPKYDDQIRDTLDEWIYFLKHEEIRDDFKAKGIKAARDKLDVMKMKDDERRRYQAYLEDLRYQASMVETHYGQGRRSGLEEGRLKERRLLVRNMGKQGMTAAQISTATGLTEKEVQALLASD